MLRLNEQQDDSDYSMSDLFVSETRPRPYRTGFRSRQHPRRPSLAYINSLCDREFAGYIRHGCRLQDSDVAVEAELEELRHQIRELQAQMRALRQATTKPTQNRPSQRGGLNVAPRT